jgi:hypothetical protein
MKYIVKNCPAKYYEFIDDEQKCFLKDKKCKHIPDCLLKQIVELCKVNNCLCDNCDGAGYFDGCKDTDCSFYMLMQIETLLGIEEE